MRKHGGTRPRAAAFARVFPGPRPWITGALAFLGPVGFAAFTGHPRENYFFTVRGSRHLVEGPGLMFTPGERLHPLTSPLGVLRPARCTAVAGPDRDELALRLFRLFNAARLASALRPDRRGNEVQDPYFLLRRKSDAP